jgi:excisionase family DNA binding protein
VIVVQIYTVKEASRKTKIGVETLKRALEEGLIKGTQLANRQWRIAESALEEALHQGIDLRGLAKVSKKKKGPIPAALRKYQESRKKK